LRANGSRECAPDDRLREAIQSWREKLDCFVASLLAMTGRLDYGFNTSFCTRQFNSSAT
jgi:hypothetical protein